VWLKSQHFSPKTAERSLIVASWIFLYADLISRNSCGFCYLNIHPIFREIAFVERLCCGLLFAVLLTGCGAGPEYVPVTGTVKFADGTVPKGDAPAITFQPVATGPKVKGASGTIAEDGTFTLQTLNPGDGAQPGDYKVTVHVMRGYPNGKWVVASKYTNAATTPLDATVDASRENHFDFTVEKP
jgi:hypothetical protein